ncbi:MAG TPA: hypothetical protein VK849_03720 [Longimicrobiales bacterium]|nr:hypothetical protein [Longimicrobiales bacterium]
MGIVGRAFLLASALGAAACGREPTRDELRLFRPDGDLLASGPSVAVSDTVAGDVMLAGGTVEFSGSAEGSYLGAGWAQRVRGRIAGSARAAGGEVRLGSDVGRNVTAAGRSVVLEPSGSVGRNAYLAGNRVLVEGSVAGDLRAAGGEIVLDGHVAGDVEVEGRTLVVGREARIDGRLRSRVDQGRASIDPRAALGGEVEALPPPPEADGTGLFAVLRLTAFVLAGAVLVLLFPGTLRSLAETLERRPGASLGWGLLWVLLAPLGVGLAALTLVGLPVALIGASLYAITLYVAPVVPGLWLGGEMLGRRFADGGTRVPGLRPFLVGGVVLAFASLLPWVGFPVRLGATCLGLGAAFLRLRTGGGRAS